MNTNIKLSEIITKYGKYLKKSFIEKIQKHPQYSTKTIPTAAEYIIDFRPGVGGKEADIFCVEIYDIFKRALCDIVEPSKIAYDDFQYMIFVSDRTIGWLLSETGTYRVQRVPQTEGSGRVHTSTISISVIAASSLKTIHKIDDDEIKVEVCRASGAGGQHVNKTNSAVRVTHKKTKIVVYQQSERSQIQNKEKAINILLTRLNKRAEEEHKKDIQGQQNQDVARSTKTTTFNWKRNEIVDHRTGYSCTISCLRDEPLRTLMEKSIIFALM